MKRIIDRIYRVYFGTPTKALLFAMALIAFSAIYTQFIFSSIRLRTEDRVEQELADVREELARTKALLEKMSSAPGLDYTSRFKQIEFDDGEEPSLLRTLDYAKYAISKDDLEYAKRLLDDATATQKTATAEHLLGVISFKSGDFKSASTHWEAALELANTNKHSDILYLLILSANEQGDSESMSTYMKKFVDTDTP